MDLPELNPRQRLILNAVVDDFIASAEPVGSQALLRKHRLDLSPATVRAVMADLEALGYLVQPHTSAGRVPTDLGYRLYVDALAPGTVNVAVNTVELETLRAQLAAEPSFEVSEVLQRVSRLLSDLSRQATVAVAPRLDRVAFRRIEFVRMGDAPAGGTRFLAIFVAHTGIVVQKAIAVPFTVTEHELERLHRVLNDLLGGLTLAEVRTRIVEEMRSEKALYDTLLTRALEMCQRALPQGNAAAPAEVVVEGQSKLFDHPEFADVERMRDIFRAFETKGLLVSLLDAAATLGDGPVRVLIGDETGAPEMRGCGLIVSALGSEREPLGALAVVGPARMDYSKLVPLVGQAARLVSEQLDVTR